MASLVLDAKLAKQTFPGGGKVRLKNAGRGIHQREIQGIDRLRHLPPEWYAFTNLDLAGAQSTSREVDVIVWIGDRILPGRQTEVHGGKGGLSRGRQRWVD